MSNEQQATSNMRYAIRNTQYAAGLYTLLTIALTYPVAFKLSSAVAGLAGRDALQYVWALWWVPKALLGLHTSPANLTFLYHPTGAHHPLLAATPYVELITLPLTLLLGARVAYNLHFLLSFVLAGMAMYWLCWQLTGNRLAAFVGGLIFAFFPNKTGHAAAGHFPQIMVYWFPLYALFLIRLLRRPRLKTALAAGLCLALASLVSLMHVAYFVIPFTLAFFLYQYWADRQRLLDRRRRRTLAIAAATAGALVAPFFAPFLLQKLGGGLTALAPGRSCGSSADLLGFVVPSPFHPLMAHAGPLAALARRIVPRPVDLQEHVAYLGLVPLALAGWGLWKRKVTRLWPILGLIALIFSLGPFLSAGGQATGYTFGQCSSRVVMPYALISKLPFYEWARTPGRLNETVMFCLAVMASFGLAAALRGLRSPAARLGLAGGLSLLIALEYVVIFPFPTDSPEPSAFYRQLAADETPRAVLNLPIGDKQASNYAMYYQTVHGHPIVGGYIHRYPPGSREMTDFIETLITTPFQPDIVALPSADERRRYLQAAGIGWVVVHTRNQVFGENLVSMLGTPIFEDDSLTAFAVPPRAATVGRLTVLKGSKWYGVEPAADGVARWMDGTGTVYLYSPAEERDRGGLRFTVAPYGWPRRFEVRVNGQSAGAFVAATGQTYTTDAFTLKPGLNVVEFSVPDGCTESVDYSVGGPGRRCLSLRFRRVEFVPGGAPLAQHPASATLGDTVEFLGYDLETGSWKLEAGTRNTEHAIHLILYWRTIRHMKEDYTVFMHLVDSQGRLVAQADVQPFDGAFPTSRWPVGAVVGCPLTISLPAEAPPGQYTLKVGLYHWPTLERLPVADDQSGENAVLLGPITVAE